MKKLNKLQINSEKIMKNEELVLLRGGYGGYCPCGTGVQTWYCYVTYNGQWQYGGPGCGSETYIRSVIDGMPYLGEGWRMNCAGGDYCY